MLKGLSAIIFMMVLFQIDSRATKYGYCDRNVILYIVVDTVKDSLVSNIKIINKTGKDIYLSTGYFYVHKGMWPIGGTLAPELNIFDLGYMQQSQDYLHIQNYFNKISPFDSMSYSCKSEIPKITKKIRISFDYLNTANLSKKFVKNNIQCFFENAYSIDQIAYIENCTYWQVDFD